MAVDEDEEGIQGLHNKRHWPHENLPTLSPCKLDLHLKNKVQQGRRRQGTRVPGRGGGAVSRASQAAKGWGFGICQVGTSMQELER